MLPPHIVVLHHNEAICAARLKWELKRQPVQYLVDGSLRTMDRRFVLVRSDTHEALSVVSGDFKLSSPEKSSNFIRN